MFYSPDLLSRTGPLAKIWLSANLERKLNKSNILQANIENSVNAIVDQGQAPMALRLSGQLLLGVVRIYSRKARYLMDDCNEALLKIKLAFRPGNTDLDMAAINPDIAAPNTLMADTLAGDIPGIPMLDESLFASGKSFDINFTLPANDPLNWSSQVISSPSIEIGRRAIEEPPSQLFDDDLGLDIDLGDDPMEPSIEVGRRAMADKGGRDDSILHDDGKLADDDLGLDLGLDDDPLSVHDSVEPSAPPEDHMDLDPLPEESLLNEHNADRNGRDSGSPLSSARSSVVREMDATFLTTGTEEPETIQARQPATKRRKVIPVDTQTELKSGEVKQMQLDRSAILKAPSMLPKDPVLLALLEMQQKGLFVSSIMGEGRTRGWAPELRGILSIEVVRKNAGMKRKRADIEAAEAAKAATPQIEIPDEDSILPEQDQVGANDDQGLAPTFDNDDDAGTGVNLHDTFDDTTMPLVHPEDQGPISQGTQHAVHLLRERFGGADDSQNSATGSPSSQRKNNVLFQDMFPEKSTNKAEATKMFFEVLVLATKDAIKVDQPEHDLGGPIRIRAKRGLWGSWAEEKAGGEAFQSGSTQVVSA